MLSEINKDFKFLSSLTKDIPSKKKDLWESQLIEWIKILVTGEEIDPEKISKFRGTSALLSEVPRNPYLNTIIRKHIYKYLRFSGYKKTCFHNFEKFS